MFRSHVEALRRYARFAELYRGRDHAMRRTAKPLRPDPSSWPTDRITMAWLGHATVLLRIFDTWVITDPVLGRRVGIAIGPAQIGVQRLTPPALRVRDLPPMDLVLLSHAHFDHLDRPTLRRLSRNAVVITPPNLGDLLTRFHDVRELRWGEATRVGDIDIEATPARHWGARLLRDQHRGWGGFLLTARGKRILFAGDTARTDLLQPLARGGPVDLAIMPIGAYDPWIANHCSPEEAWSMAMQLGAAAFAPIHHSTFRLSREPMTEPMARLREAAGASSDRIVAAALGETWTMPQPAARRR
ncbi:MAG: MBL fold metallo-hydrolase [Gemmatimonadales bacterium]